jgi:acyl-CoA reductase-like NAD-dependent aldehyde dehydrogenase
MAGNFIKQIEAAKAAKSARPAQKPISEMSTAELDAALEDSKRAVVEANKAVADAVAAETGRPDGTLAQHLGRLQRHKKRTWR